MKKLKNFQSLTRDEMKKISGGYRPPVSGCIVYCDSGVPNDPWGQYHAVNVRDCNNTSSYYHQVCLGFYPGYSGVNTSCKCTGDPPPDEV